MNKNVWESIDELFESNGKESNSGEEDDELDQNELLGIIDDEEYQQFLSSEKM